jgi:beta-phosphoglucomutase-like phosphatase (HAD superfamily)
MTSQQSKIAVFDLDGTLIETDAANSAAYRAAMRKNGVDVFGVYGRITALVIRQILCDNDKSDVDAIVDDKVSMFCHELWRTKLGPAAYNLRCVMVERSAFDKVVLLTDSSERRAMETLNYHCLAGCFDEIVCNGGKGDKYANYFRGFDSDPAACVVWENEDGQIKSAIAAGVKMENIRKVG